VTVNRLAMRGNVVIVACVVASERLDVVPEEVLAAFGAAGVVPVRLPGGQGTAWRAGQPVTDLVLARFARQRGNESGRAASEVPRDYAQPHPGVA
jgi:hypothetical protein